MFPPPPLHLGRRHIGQSASSSQPVSHFIQVLGILFFYYMLRVYGGVGVIV